VSGVAIRGWILYDGRCPFCRHSVRRCGGIAVKRGYRLMPLQRSWVKAKLAAQPGTTADAMLLLLPDGTFLEGVDAYLQLCRRIWWAWPFGWIGAIPGIYWLLGRAYAWVARNRLGISRRCGLDGCSVR